MSVHKVIEVMAQSDRGWEDAAQAAVSEASETVKGIKSVHLKELHGVVENNRIVQYRVNVKLTFEVASDRSVA